jgi:L-alanine-DL-glutamate epimerase-like enolase superfamily enzyme
MHTTLRLLAAELHYPEELQVHTAASGPVPSLAARYLQIDRSDGFQGIGEIRANIGYVSHLTVAGVEGAIRDLCRRLPWSAEPDEVLARLREPASAAPHVATAAIENALIEGIARERGQPVAHYLGGTGQDRIETNQCLFWSPDTIFDRLAARFLAEGFRQLKVRIAVADFATDLARLSRLRRLAGPDIAIAVDANGAWTADEAIERLRALERFDLSYVEQPTTPGDWAGFAKVQRMTSLPLMLDESLADADDIERLCAVGPPALAHLKIVKLGGPGAVVAAMRRLSDAGVGVMVGQMSEGAMATAITVHCAMALRPRHAELYGCYGLLDDATAGVSYVDGKVGLSGGPGLGVRFDAGRCRTVWSERFEH